MHKERTQLKKARESRYWSLEKAAEKLGISAATLSRWETGKTSPHPDNIRILCEVFGLPPQELGFTKDEEIQISTEEPDDRSDAIRACTKLIQENLEFRLHCLIYQWLHHPRRLRIELQIRMQQEIERDTMSTTQPGFDPARRTTLHRLAWLPIQALGLSIGITASTPTISHASDIMTHCAAGIVACQQLSKGQHEDLTLALTALSHYLPALIRIVRDDSTNRQEAARLTAQAFLLKATLGVHREGTEQALRTTQQSLKYSEESGDTSLQLVILRRLAWIYFCANQHQKAIDSSLQAKSLLEHTDHPFHPSIRAIVYASAAKYLALDDRKYDPLPDLKRAHKIFFADDKGQPTPFYTGFNLWNLIGDDGRAHYYMEKHDQALDSFTQLVDFDTLSTKIPISSELVKIETINNATFAMLKQPEKDMDQVIKLWEAGVEGANALMSDQRFRETEKAYEMMQAVWPGEKDIKDLRGKLKHW